MIFSCQSLRAQFLNACCLVLDACCLMPDACLLLAAWCLNTCQTHPQRIPQRGGGRRPPPLCGGGRRPPPLHGGWGGGKHSKNTQTYQQMCIEYVYWCISEWGICPFGIWYPWVRGGWGLDALGKFFRRRRRRRRRPPGIGVCVCREFSFSRHQITQMQP